MKRQDVRNNGDQSTTAAAASLALRPILAGLTAGLVLLLVSSLTATAAYAADGQIDDSDNVVIVLDASGSMNEYIHGVRKIDAARNALKQVINQLPDKVRVGIMVFPDRGWIYPLSAKDNAKVGQALDSVSPGGNTPLGDYVRDGANALIQQRVKQYNYGTYRLLVVTDGEANAGMDVADAVAKSIRRGLIVDAIGVNMPQNHTLATRVHTYRRADDPNSLATAVRQVFAEITATGSNAVSDADFALIAPLSAETVTAAITALAKSVNNRPVAEGRDEPVGGNASAGGGGSGGSGATATPGTSGSGPQAGCGGGCSISNDHEDGIGWPEALVLIALIAVAYLLLRRG